MSNKGYREAVQENWQGKLPHGDPYPVILDRIVDYGILLLFPLTGLFLCLAAIFASLWVIVWVLRSLFS
jgi:hypothetical protein